MADDNERPSYKKVNRAKDGEEKFSNEEIVALLDPGDMEELLITGDGVGKELKALILLRIVRGGI